MAMACPAFKWLFGLNLSRTLQPLPWPPLQFFLPPVSSHPSARQFGLDCPCVCVRVCVCVSVYVFIHDPPLVMLVPAFLRPKWACVSRYCLSVMCVRVSVFVWRVWVCGYVWCLCVSSYTICIHNSTWARQSTAGRRWEERSGWQLIIWQAPLLHHPSSFLPLQIRGKLFAEFQQFCLLPRLWGRVFIKRRRTKQTGNFYFHSAKLFLSKIQHAACLPTYEIL